MRFYLLLALSVSLVGALGVVAQEKKPPAKLVFETKNGNVTYDHAAHLKREKNDCKVCHDALWPQAKAPLHYKTAVHKTAEAKQASCGFCHRPGGKSFESKANCNKCHVKAAKPAA